ncbi:type IV toxin-antitoxin system AbiEi family antitoxin domain-containing protein [Streptomyces sp. NPDC001380]|uniref:type IV toxin-antitoxin system AbiEi family antitoxin domain-containing protein n=1 Tax=Streptomyces sp. NPDC001380 TaxID=3364566 RepID=UPI00369943C2
MNRAEQLSLLGGIAADQWGLVTAAQAKEAGLNGVQLRRLTEAGLLESISHGVYLLIAAGQPRHLEIKAAWLRLQPAAPAWQRSPGDPDSGVVSHASACQLHELGDIPAPKVEISVPRRRVTNDPFVRLRTAAVDPADITLVDGLPVTTAHRTILDLLHAKADGGHIGGVIAEAERRDLITLDALADTAQPFARKYGLAHDVDGLTLIDHLVAQAGESLRHQQLERAADQGFATALQLLAPSNPPLLAPALQEMMRQRSEELTASWRKALSDAVPALTSPPLTQLLHEAAARPEIEAPLQAAAARMRKAMEDALPQLLPLETIRRLRETAQVNPVMLHALRSTQNDAAAAWRASLHKPDGRMLQPADSQDREA